MFGNERDCVECNLWFCLCVIGPSANPDVYPYIGFRLLQEVGAKKSTVIKLPKIVLRSINNILKIFAVKYEESTESFNDSVMSNFLADKEILRWESHFFERKNEYFWTVLVEYYPSAIAQREALWKKEKSSRDENYKGTLTETDLPLFNTLREWRAERSKEEGVPTYSSVTTPSLPRMLLSFHPSENNYVLILF